MQEIYDHLGLGDASNTFTVMGVAAPQEPEWVAGYRQLYGLVVQPTWLD